MHIEISTRHGHVSEQTQEKVAAKLQRLTRFFDRISAIEVTIDLDRREALSVDLRVLAKQKHDFVATGRSDDLMAAVDAVVEKMEQQLRKHKEKVQERHRGSGHRQQETPSEAGPGDL